MTTSENYVQTTCDLVADADDDALVVASPGSWAMGGHVTVVHAHGRAEVIDAAISMAGLRSSRIDATRTKVYPS